jgi:hypothetical protein
VPAMKLTPIAAMRARDVSRPRAEHLAEAEEAEARNPGRPQGRPGDAATEARGGERTRTPRATADDGERTRTPRATADGGDERAGRPGFPRRRRGRGSR